MYKVNSIVRLTPDVKKWYEDNCTKEDQVARPDYYKGFVENSSFIYLGEIVNMEGHGIYAGKDGVVHWGFHLEDFEEDPDISIEIDSNDFVFDDDEDN